MTAYKNISINDFTYHLPDERIARYPLAQRDASKLLIFKDKEISQTIFREITNQLPQGSLLVFNNTKVVQARMHFRKETGANIEIFCIEPVEPKEFAMAFSSTGSCRWTCIAGNLKKWKDGKLTKIFYIDNTEYVLEIERVASVEKMQVIDFKWNSNDISFAQIMEVCGEMPIPPYLNREAEPSDTENYQTVYSKINGSVAAPTAGLHFTENVFNSLKIKNIKTDELTLHVGAGTFVPVKSETIGGHTMHTEHFFVSKSLIRKLLVNKEKVIAVGTTSVRTLESIYWLGVKCLMGEAQPEFVSQWDAYELKNDVSTEQSLGVLLEYMQQKNIEILKAATQIIIVPTYTFRIINGIVTNFHQPQSTLLLLIAAFVGENWKSIYNYALQNQFRFLSYGDSSLLLK